MQKFFQGTLRPKIKPLGVDLQTGVFQIEVEWVERQTDQSVWRETITIPPGNAAFSQIECTGYARPVDGCFIDEKGNRHFVLRAEPIQFGARMG